MTTINFSSYVTPLKGGSYFGAHDLSITTALDAKRDEWARAFDPTGGLSERKATRDGSSNLHVTVVSPPEMRKLDRAVVEQSLRGPMQFEAIGVGCVRDEGNEAWFIVLESPEGQEVRRELGLPAKDFHATLGFKVKDIFHTPKTEATLITDWRTA